MSASNDPLQADTDPNALYPPEPKELPDRGLAAPLIKPNDPQWYLAGRQPPNAPFVGNALKWDSWVFDDGTT